MKSLFIFLYFISPSIWSQTKPPLHTLESVISCNTGDSEILIPYTVQMTFDDKCGQPPTDDKDKDKYKIESRCNMKSDPDFEKVYDQLTKQKGLSDRSISNCLYNYMNGLVPGKNLAAGCYGLKEKDLKDRCVNSIRTIQSEVKTSKPEIDKRLSSWQNLKFTSSGQTFTYPQVMAHQGSKPPVDPGDPVTPVKHRFAFKEGKFEDLEESLWQQFKDKLPGSTEAQKVEKERMQQLKKDIDDGFAKAGDGQCQIFENDFIVSKEGLALITEKFKASDKNEKCKKNLELSLANSIYQAQLPYDECAKHPALCKEMRDKSMKIIKDLKKDGIFTEYFSPTCEKGDDCCKEPAELREVRTFITDLKEILRPEHSEKKLLGCTELAPGEEKMIQGGTVSTGTPANYRLIRDKKDPNKYKAKINVTFLSNDGNIKTKDVRDKVLACLKSSKKNFLGPKNKDGSRMSLEIELENEEFVNDMKNKPHIVTITPDNSYRTDSKTWALKDTNNCPTMTHELLHVMGLIDCYHEPDKISVESAKKEVSTDLNSPYGEWNCRQHGPTDSIMAHQESAFNLVKHPPADVETCRCYYEPKGEKDPEKLKKLQDEYTTCYNTLELCMKVISDQLKPHITSTKKVPICSKADDKSYDLKKDEFLEENGNARALVKLVDWPTNEEICNAPGMKKVTFKKSSQFQPGKLATFNEEMPKDKSKAEDQLRKAQTYPMHLIYTPPPKGKAPGSLLYEAEFMSLVTPGSCAATKTYRKCSLHAYDTSREHYGGGCDLEAPPKQCQDPIEWMQVDQ